METKSPLERAAEKLVATVEADWKSDVPFGSWHASEGERVLEESRSLLAAVQAGTLRDLLAGSTIPEFLGESWLGVHEKSYEQATALQGVASELFAV